MDAVDFLKVWKQICATYRDSVVSCFRTNGCPFHQHRGSWYCHDWAIKINPEEAVAIVQKWAEEHPQKTMLQDVLEKYPNVPLDVDIPRFCPSHLGYEKYKPDFCKSSECRKCWNRPLEE